MNLAIALILLGFLAIAIGLDLAYDPPQRALWGEEVWEYDPRTGFVTSHVREN